VPVDEGNSPRAVPQLAAVCDKAAGKVGATMPGAPLADLGHEPVATPEQLASGRDTRPRSLRRVVVFAILAALSVSVAAQAHPLTTRPQLELDVRVTLTDTRIVLDRHTAPRGVEARFHIRNTGAKTHNFTLNGPKLGSSRRQGFSRTLKPGQHENVRLLLDVRARQTYFSGLSADRSKPSMRGVFVTR
jgi:hypothetical protein